MMLDVLGDSLSNSYLFAQTGLNLDFRQIAPNIPFILGGIVTTLSFTLVSAIFGFTWGTILSVFKISNIKPLKWFADFYTSVFRGTPLILQLAIIYFSTPQLIGWSIPPFIAGVITFSLNSAAYSSETIRGGILGVDKGQREAALTMGVPYKNILPALVNESIALLKDSSLVSTVGALDLMRRGQIVAAEKFIYFEPLIVVGLVYYIMVTGFTWLAQRFERRIRKSD
jgi:arginine/lysine/histidine transport system permease protein